MDIKNKISETVSLLFLFINAGTIAFTLPSLPDTIPIHSAGQADGYGSKYLIWLIFGISVCMYAGLTVLSKYPGFYKNRMTQKNTEEQYRLTSKMLRTLKVIVLFFFTLLTYVITQTAQLKIPDSSNLLIVLPFVLIFPTVIYYLIKLGKVR